MDLAEWVVPNKNMSLTDESNHLTVNKIFNSIQYSKKKTSDILHLNR